MKEVYKMVTDKHETTVSPVLEFHTNTITTNTNCLIRVSITIFANIPSLPRIVNTCNSLPYYVVNVDSVEVFKEV